MRGGLVLLGVVGLLALLVAAPGRHANGQLAGLPLRQPAPTFAGKLFGFVYGSSSTRLARIDPVTLRALPGRSRPLPGVLAWAASPDRSRLAVAECGRGSSCRGLVQLFAMPSMRPLGRKVAIGPPAVALAWAGNNRLLVLAGHCCAGSADVVTLDARSGRVTERRPVPGTVVRFARSTAGFVLLAGPRNRIGPAELVVADGRRLRTVKLARVEAGFIPGRIRSAAISTDRFPGLAVEDSGRCAYVVDPDGTIATVSLGSLKVSYHRPGASRTLFARLDGWLEPVAQAKGDRGPWRQAQWLDDGLLAVTGTDWHATGSVSGNVISERLHERPAGLEIINTRSWQQQTVDSHADTVTITNGLLLATGTRWDVTPGENRTSGEGLVAYDAHGRLRFRLFKGRSVYVNLVIGRRAYLTVTAPSGHQHEYAVNLRTRAVTAMPDSEWPWLLLGAAQPASG
jgi:hypothetical protein